MFYIDRPPLFPLRPVFCSSAQMGVVVDDRFLVKGFDNLRIADASVLNQVTRLNPFFTLTAMGRYAGLIINDDVVHRPPSP